MTTTRTDQLLAALAGLLVLALAVVATVQLRPPTVSEQAQAATRTANGYASHIGANYACTALGMASWDDSHAWLVESRGFTAHDATALLELAADRGCVRP